MKQKKNIKVNNITKADHNGYTVEKEGNMKKKKIYGVYANTADITYIMEDTFIGEELESTEVIGFVFGNYEDNTKVLKQYSGKIKAEFQEVSKMKVRISNENGTVKIIKVLSNGKEQVLIDNLKDGQIYEVELSLRVKEGLVKFQHRQHSGMTYKSCIL